MIKETENPESSLKIADSVRPSAAAALTLHATKIILSKHRFPPK
jgi:hypothetical protein